MKLKYILSETDVRQHVLTINEKRKTPELYMKESWNLILNIIYSNGDKYFMKISGHLSALRYIMY